MNFIFLAENWLFLSHKEVEEKWRSEEALMLRTQLELFIDSNYKSNRNYGKSRNKLPIMKSNESTEAESAYAHLYTLYAVLLVVSKWESEGLQTSSEFYSWNSS